MKPITFPYQDGRTTNSSEGRQDQMRRDNDVVKVPRVGLYDIDYAIFYHLKDVFKPSIIENDVSIPVPVMFANGEKWAQIRANGFMRDAGNKIQSPAMVIKRNDISDDIRLTLHTGQIAGINSTRLIPYKTMGMQYDKTAGQYLRKDSLEFYIVDKPDYIRLTYDLIIWTDLQEQMNSLVQNIIPMNNHMWGDFYKFRTVITSTTHDNVNIPGEDRIVKTTMALQVDGYLRGEYEYQESKLQKAYSIKTVKFLEESSEQVIFDQIQDLNNPSIENSATQPHGDLRRKIR